MRPSKEDRVRVRALVGIGLDGNDGHQRVTRSDEFLIVGGSEETHERMQETAIRFAEALERRGTSLADADVAEVIELLCEARQAKS